MLRRCTESDLPGMCAVINDAAQAYKGVIRADCWHEPYMPLDELSDEVRNGVEFWGFEEAGELVGVMGIQDKGPVTLVRHAYVRTAARQHGIGSRLLRHLEGFTAKPILVGTWIAATWAVRSYEKHGYTAVSRDETDRLLRLYWRLPEHQILTSVVLAKAAGGSDPAATSH